MIRCAITDGSGSIVNIERWLAAGIELIQIREKQMSSRQLAAFTRAATAFPNLYGSKLLVNDRADIALACGAHGVHLRDGSVSPLLLRKILPAGFLVTVSCHHPEDLALAEGADYALVAPVFKPLSKEDHREPLGLAGLAKCKGTPVIALGGITWDNAKACIDAGAVGVAGITLCSGQNLGVGANSGG